jgi:hypothetical protein
MAPGVGGEELQGRCGRPALVADGLADADDEVLGCVMPALRSHDLLQFPLKLRSLEARCALPEVLREIGGALLAELTVKVVLDLV